MQVDMRFLSSLFICHFVIAYAEELQNHSRGSTRNLDECKDTPGKLNLEDEDVVIPQNKRCKQLKKKGYCTSSTVVSEACPAHVSVMQHL